VLLELIENATVLSPAGSTVRLAWHCVGGEGVHVSITDAGPGVPAELRDRIFDPFFSTRAGGTGLGLAVAKQVVEAHGGTIDVDDRDDGAPSGGACFRVHLPASKTALSAA